MHETDFKNLSVLYLYGELTGHKKKLFEEHIAGCEGCRKELEEMKETLGLLNTLPPEDPAPELRRIVLEKAISYRDRRKSPFEQLSFSLFRFRKILRVGLAMLMLFAGMFMIISFVMNENKPDTAGKTPTAVTVNKENDTVATAADIASGIDTVQNRLKSAELESLGASDIADLNVNGNYGSRLYPQFADASNYGEYMNLKSEADDIVKMMSSY
ncbi:MAG: zf-HC2 domain-containing protein [Firmicutes bacterium]|nr:zf-HC2 domain-containing protein [Bacillota bacterium]